MTTALDLLPPARWRDVLLRRARLIGSRLDPTRPRGRISPVEARVLLGLAYDSAVAIEAQRLATRSLMRDLLTLVSVVIARAMAPTGRAASRPWIVATHVDNLSASEAVEQIFGDDARPPGLVCFVHPHAVNLASRDPLLRETLAAADLVLPDGVGLRLAGRLLGVDLRHNINGTDLLPMLCAAAATRGIPLVLVGAAPGVAEDCAAKLRATHPGLAIPIVSHGYLDDEASHKLASQITGLGRALVLVGMGSPRQELWAARYLRGLPGVTAVTVGGLFDFYAGRVRRAPVVWRELGIEWVWRLRQEPRRMWKRYIVGNPLFVARVLRQRLRRPSRLLGSRA